MKRYSVAAAGAAMVLLVGNTQAHHSGAMFDTSKEARIVGTIQEFNWTNPHSSFKVTVVDAAGKQETWAVEMGSPNNLVREGWKRTTLKMGDQVTVTVRPLRDGTPGGLFMSVILADGRQLGGESGGNTGSAPSGS